MIPAKPPFFLKNKNWYIFNEKECRYELTKKAPKEAIESYEKFYKDLENTKYGDLEDTEYSEK